jgi:hypothetical protein
VVVEKRVLLVDRGGVQRRVALYAVRRRATSVGKAQ